MEIPARSHPSWKAVIMGEKTCDFEFLGLQMLLKRLTIKVALNPTSNNVNQSIYELRKMFVENIKLAKVQRDLDKIFGKEGGLS